MFAWQIDTKFPNDPEYPATKYLLRESYGRLREAERNINSDPSKLARDQLNALHSYKFGSIAVRNIGNDARRVYGRR